VVDEGVTDEGRGFRQRLTRLETALATPAKAGIWRLGALSQKPLGSGFRRNDGGFFPTSWRVVDEGVTDEGRGFRQRPTCLEAPLVTPAKAGIWRLGALSQKPLGSGFRRNDGGFFQRPGAWLMKA